MASKKQIIENIEKIKHCIEFGHQYKFSEFSRYSDTKYVIFERCKNCNFPKHRTASEEEVKALKLLKIAN